MKKNMTAKKRSDLGKTKKINGKPYILINIINSLPDAVALFNTKPELLHYNPAFTEFAAKSNKSSPRKKMKLTDFFTKKNAPQINNLMDETLKGKETKRVIEIKIKAGEKKYYELTLIPVLQKSKTDSVVLIVKDISKLKNESEELETLNERFKIVTKSANIGIWEYNFSDGTLYCNREMYNIFGKTSPDSNISDWISLIHPDDRKILAERYKNYVWTTKHTNEIESCCDYFEADFRIITGTDTIKHIASHTNIYRQQRGIYEKAVGACYDITMLKKNIEELRYAKNAAERAMAARSEFLTNISHEIRTPMNAIIGFTEMILASEQNEKNKNYLKTILSSGKTLLALINDILDFSKMESGKLGLKPAAVCFNDVISEIRNIFQESAQSKNLQFQITTGKNLPEIIIIDDIRLRQILFNLISNAIKFTKSGYVRIGFEARKIKQDTEFDLIISVEDTGTGIKSENIGKIFEPFYQENISGSCKTPGTGLGLAITKKITELMNGTISFKSTEGKGTKFTVKLPGIKIHKEKRPTDIELLKTEQIEIEFNKPKITFICDNPQDGEKVIEFLKDYQADVELKEKEIFTGDVVKGFPGGTDLAVIIFGEEEKDSFLCGEIKRLTASENIPAAEIKTPLSKYRVLQEIKKFIKIKRKEKLDAYRIKDYDKLKDILEEYSAESLRELYKDLSGSFLPECGRIIEFPETEEIRNFAKSLNDYFSGKDFEFLKIYSAELINKAESFDMQKTEELLSAFTLLVKSLKNYTINENGRSSETGTE